MSATTPAPTASNAAARTTARKAMATKTMPALSFSLSGYTSVLILRTDEVAGHLYRVGQKPTVDAATLAALTAKQMVADVKPAG